MPWTKRPIPSLKSMAPRPEGPDSRRPPGLEEAAERRAKADALLSPAEKGGPSGPEPTRFGDWERKGLAVDF